MNEFMCPDGTMSINGQCPATPKEYFQFDFEKPSNSFYKSADQIIQENINQYNTLNAPFTSNYKMTPGQALAGLIAAPISTIGTAYAYSQGYPSFGYMAIAKGLNPFNSNPGMSYGASNFSGAVDTGDYGSTTMNQAQYGGYTHDMSESSHSGGGMGSSDPGGSDSMGSF